MDECWEDIPGWQTSCPVHDSHEFGVNPYDTFDAASGKPGPMVESLLKPFVAVVCTLFLATLVGMGVWLWLNR